MYEAASEHGFVACLYAARITRVKKVQSFLADD